MSEIRPKKASLDHVLKYMGVFGGVQGLTMLMGIVRNKLASLFLGTAGFGLMAIYNSITELVQSGSNLGLPIASVQQLSELFESGDDAAITHFVKVVRTWSFWAALLCITLTLALAPFLAHLFFENEPSRIWDIMWLAPMAAMAIVFSGEASILKGLRHLKRVASISAISAVTTLCLTVPFFWAMGLRGILLSLNISTLAVLAVHFMFTLPLFPWRIGFFSRDIFREGLPLLRIGIPYVLAAVVGTGCAMLLQAFLKRESSEETLGLYRVAYTLMVSYAGIAFSAFEADYFPRLSSVNHHREDRNEVINQQIRVGVMVVAPMMLIMLVFMPVILSLLFKDEFLPAADMAVCAVFYTFLRAITVPIGYTALACGHSMRYMVMEAIYDVVSLLLIAYSYHIWGLMGAGIGLSLSALFDLLLISITYGILYQFRMTVATACLAIGQAVMVAISLGVCLLLPPMGKYIVGSLLIILSLTYSYRYLSKESDIIQKIQKKLRR